MKKLVLAVTLLLAVMTGHTQSFEGIMRWSMKMDITDPKAKEQMEQIAKMMGNQATNGMMPTGVTIKLKGLNSLTSIEGGIMDKNDVLFIADKGTSYTINHKQKSYMVVPKSSETTDEKAPKITKTSETAKIMNYTCTKYIIETPGANGNSATVNYWATTEIKDIDLKALAKQQMAKGQQFVYADIEGVPLKVEMSLPEGTMTMEAVEFKKTSLPASDFAVPAGYKEMKM